MDPADPWAEVMDKTEAAPRQSFAPVHAPVPLRRPETPSRAPHTAGSQSNQSSRSPLGSQRSSLRWEGSGAAAGGFSQRLEDELKALRARPGPLQAAARSVDALLAAVAAANAGAEPGASRGSGGANGGGKGAKAGRGRGGASPASSGAASAAGGQPSAVVGLCREVCAAVGALPPALTACLPVPVAVQGQDQGQDRGQGQDTKAAWLAGSTYGAAAERSTSDRIVDMLARAVRSVRL